jgi:hypothetical protein
MLCRDGVPVVLFRHAIEFLKPNRGVGRRMDIYLFESINSWLSAVRCASNGKPGALELCSSGWSVVIEQVHPVLGSRQNYLLVSRLRSRMGNHSQWLLE